MNELVQYCYFVQKCLRMYVEGKTIRDGENQMLFSDSVRRKRLDVITQFKKKTQKF